MGICRPFGFWLQVGLRGCVAFGFVAGSEVTFVSAGKGCEGCCAAWAWSLGLLPSGAGDPDAQGVLWRNPRLSDEGCSALPHSNAVFCRDLRLCNRCKDVGRGTFSHSQAKQPLRPGPRTTVNAFTLSVRKRKSPSRSHQTQPLRSSRQSTDQQARQPQHRAKRHPRPKRTTPSRDHQQPTPAIRRPQTKKHPPAPSPHDERPA